MKRKNLVVGPMAVAILLAAHAFGASSPSTSDPKLKLIGKFKNTYYMLALQADYPSTPATEDVLDMNDKVLAKVTPKFKKKLDLEGSARLEDGRVVNFAGRKNKSIRYYVSIHPYGTGVGDCALVPFHSIAVDPKKIALGSLVQIDETIGMELPDGTRHDGTWRAVDIGSAIIGNRVDLFVGGGDQGQVLTTAGIQNMQALTIRLIDPPANPNCSTEIPR